MMNFTRLLELDVLILEYDNDEETYFTLKDNIIVETKASYPVDTLLFNKNTNTITISNYFCSSSAYDIEVDYDQDFIVKVKIIQIIEELLT